PVRIAFAAETTKSWLVLFARVVRPTERSARLPARQQPGYVYVGDLGHRVATSSTFSKQQRKPRGEAGAFKEKLMRSRDQGALDAPILSQSTNQARRIEVPMREAKLTARTPRRSGHRHTCDAYLADVARAK